MATAITTSIPNVFTTVSGKVLDKDFRKGVGDILVQLFDLDDWADPEAGTPPAGGRDAPTIARDLQSVIGGDVTNLYKIGECVGTSITSSTGEFTIQMTAKDFNLARKTEQKPDVVLLLLAPDEPGMDLNKRVLHLSRDIRFNACSNEAHIILLPTPLLKERGIPFGEETEETQETTRNKVREYTGQKDREQQFNEGVAAYHGAQAVRDREQRKTFRKEFIAKIAKDFHTVPVRGVFIDEGENIRDKNMQTFSSGVLAANQMLDSSNARGVPVNLYVTPADKPRLDPFFNNAVGEFVDIPDADVKDILFRSNSSENPGTLLIHNNPFASFCASETDDLTCAKLHAGVSSHHDETSPTNPTAPEEGTITDDDVLTYVDRLVRNIPPPDVVLRPELAKPRGAKDIDTAVGQFSLQKGPAEEPALYDFHSVQIAFDHVWMQLFDETIPNLAYTANAIGKARFGIDDLISGGLRSGLLTDFFGTVTPVEVPAVVARFFDITKEEYNEMSPTIRQELQSIANEVKEYTGKAIYFPNYTFKLAGSKISDLRIIQSLVEQGERLIDGVRHDDYYTLHRTLRELHARLTSKYEFTVFAADKDYHSVNFGLWTTYREHLMPDKYQAGKLLKTIPLAPMEERKYSVKVNRHEKRSSKEAKRNNSSLTNEQATTSRVEADIMAKAQNKTNFGITAEGDFDVGIYEGKATTTFGIEAVSESAQNRKDFREAVLKAAQEYKNETTLEVTTESDFASETTESGSIKNENLEKAVTYVFYELQRRYKLSEQIYRVMPVVLVAQQVPSPDQITPAWVIAHDWILNRCLLDDSFRPTLKYLSSKSVGDDFALRELRKNLRQQRNLVETLRIEFSAASMQADMRYAALEAQISKRINAEEAEANDGLLNDIADFVGRGPGLTALFGDPKTTDPEAAKARELAAKDAHQYALEKAEKAATALKQEVNKLHELTEHYNKTLQARLDNETQVKRLLVHIRAHILDYMKIIWSMESADQRRQRLLNVEVPVLELESRTYRVKVAAEDPDIFAPFREPGTEKHRAFLHGKLKHNANGKFDTKPLVEVADIMTLLGCVANYLVFPMKQHNALTEFMAAPYIDSAFGAMDPDELTNVSLEQYSKYVCCLHDTLDEDDFNAMKEQLKEWLEKLMAAPVRNGDEIVVPTGSLFIESLVDPNTVLEEFKLKHRELDVYKVQAEVRWAELKNVLLAARLLNKEHDDPDIDKKILIEGSPQVVVPPDS